MPSHQGDGVRVSEPRSYLYSVTCWEDKDCEPLDTYGGAEVLDMAREHVAKHGCKLRVEVQSIIDVEPVA